MFFKNESNKKTTTPNSPSTVTQGSPSSSPIPIISKKPKNTPKEHIASTATGHNLFNKQNSYLHENMDKIVQKVKEQLRNSAIDENDIESDNDSLGNRMSF